MAIDYQKSTSQVIALVGFLGKLGIISGDLSWQVMLKCYREV